MKHYWYLETTMTSYMMQESRYLTPKVCGVCLELFRVSHSLFCLPFTINKVLFSKIWQGKETCIQGPGFVLRLLHTLTCSRSLAWDDPVNYEFRWRNQSSVGFSELLLVSNSKGQSQPWTSEVEPLGPSFSHIPMFHFLVGNATQQSWLTHLIHACAGFSKLPTHENHLRSLSENSKPHFRGSCCMGAVWAPGVWIFASTPSQSPATDSWGYSMGLASYEAPWGNRHEIPCIYFHRALLRNIVLWFTLCYWRLIINAPPSESKISTYIDDSPVWGWDTLVCLQGFLTPKTCYVQKGTFIPKGHNVWPATEKSKSRKGSIP